MTTYTYPYRYHPVDGEFSGAWHADYSAADPSFIVATCAPATTFNPLRSGYSTDGGYTWTQFPTRPLNTTDGIATFGIGSIHVGSSSNIIWVSDASRGTYRTTDRGATWSPLVVSGVSVATLNQQAYFFYRRPIAFEKTAASADTCYLHAPANGFYRSLDGGATWTQRCDGTPFAGANWTQHAYLKSVPNQPGHLFITPGYQGSPANPALTLPFLRSTDGGATWSQVGSMKSVRGFDFGKSAPGQSYPAIYAVGVYSGVVGVWRSDDNAVTWNLLSTQPNGTVDFIRNVGASKDVYGKHWITTQGSGLIVGQLAP